MGSAVMPRIIQLGLSSGIFSLHSIKTRLSSLGVCVGANEQQVLRLQQIIRFANDLLPLRMTVLLSAITMTGLVRVIIRWFGTVSFLGLERRGPTCLSHWGGR